MKNDNSESSISSILKGLVPNIPGTELLRLLPTVRLLKLKKNHDLFCAGEQGTHIYVLISGLMYVYYPHSVGKEQVKRFVSSGQAIAPYISILSQKPSKYGARTLKNCILLSIPYSSFVNCTKSNPLFWNAFFRKELEFQILEREEKEYELFMLNAELRYQSFLKRHSKVHLEIPRYLIASYIGITPEALSRISNLRKE